MLQRPGAFSQGDWFLSTLAEYARSPLVREVSYDPDVPGQTEALVDDLLAFNFSLGVAPHERLRFDLAAPVYGLSTGAARIPDGPTMGDLRLSSMVVAVRPAHLPQGGGFGLGIVGNLDIPSGNPERYLGKADLAGGAKLALTYESPIVTATADVGAQFDPSLQLQNLEGSDHLVAGLAVGFLTSDLVGLTVEGNIAPPLQVPQFTDAQTLPPAEALLSMRIRTRTGPFVTFGAAGGLTDGPGVPSYRAFLGLGYSDAEPAAPPDADPLFALRSNDRCPLEDETFNDYKDDDGCPDRLGTLAIDVRFRGESRAADAVVVGPEGAKEQRIGTQGFALDAVPGSQWTVRANDGCLHGEASATAAEGGAHLVVELVPRSDATARIEVLGTDGLSLPTAQVVWHSDRMECVPNGPNGVSGTGALVQPIASGTHTLIVTAPHHNVHEQRVTLNPGQEVHLPVQLAASKIVVEKKRIRILEKVQFETAKAVIRPSSFSLLDEVAATIITNPHLGRVEVQGHTDSRGTTAYNQRLSEDRAASVRDYLLGKSVPPERLVSRGYGESSPIETNKTPDGREANRRVAFKLIDVTD